MPPDRQEDKTISPNLDPAIFSLCLHAYARHFLCPYSMSGKGKSF